MRGLLLLLSITTLLIALYLGALYGFTPYATIQTEFADANRQIRPSVLPFAITALSHSAVRYAMLRGTIVLVMGAAALYLFAIGAHRVRHESRRLAQEITRAVRSIATFWHGLARSEQWTAGILLLLILGMRCWFLQHTAFNPDEMVSLDYFARPGPRIAASFYQLPNNHIFYNVLGAFLLQIAPSNVNSELLIRLPSFVIGLVSTAMIYAVLARLASFRVATFSICCSQLFPMSVEYSITARGYGLQAACVYALFLAIVVLLRGPAYHRVAWVVVIIASLSGLYLIPTFIYPLLSLGTGLLFGALSARQGRIQGAQTVVAGAGILLLGGLLYLPLGLLSGWHTLLANPYVARLSTNEFWTLLGPYYLWDTLGALLGKQLITIPLLLLLMSGGLALTRRWGTPRHWHVAALAWIGVLGPLPLLALQRVFAPPRTLHYLVFFVVLLAALLFEAIVRRTRLPSRIAWLVLGIGLAGYAGFRLPRQAQSLEIDHTTRAQAVRAYQWLRLRNPHRVFTDFHLYHNYLQHLALAGQQPPLPLQLAGTGPISNYYDYLMLKRGSPMPSWATRQPYHLAYQHADLVIYRLQRPPAILSPQPLLRNSAKLPQHGF